MSKCPHCGGDLVQDEQNINKLLCYNCHKRYDVDKINQYWAERGGATAPSPQPYQPEAQQPYQPTQPAQPVQGGYQPTAPMPQPDPYGQPQQGMYPQQQPYGGVPAYMQPQLPKGTAIAALVIGILTLFFSPFPVIPIISGIIAVILGIVGISKASKGLAGGKGLAIGGIITAVIGIIISLLVTVLLAGMISWTMDEIENGNFNVNVNDYNYNLADEDDLNSLLNELDNELDNLNSNLNSNLGSTANSNSVSNANANANSNSTASNTAPSSASAAGGSWQQGEFSLDGKKFTMGQTTLKQLADATGWTIDLAEAGYEDGYVVEKNQRLSAIMLDNPAYSDSSIYLSVSVANASEERLDIMDCPIFSISISAWNLDKPYPECSINGVGLGDDLSKAAGVNPAAELTEGDGYATYDFDDGGYYITFKGDPDKIDGITFNSYNY